MVVDVAVHSQCTLGEGPVWDRQRQCLWWVDILQGEIHQFFPETNKHQKLSINQMIGTVAICSDGRLIAALKNGIGFVDHETGAVKIIVNPEAEIPNNRFNDGKCDPAGRFWAGTLSLREEPGAGNLYMIDCDFSVEKKVSAVTISNGLAWTQDHQTLYYIDTPTQSVAAFDFDVSSGRISNKRVVIDVRSEKGYPDGMTIDADGMLWIAQWDGWRIIRWNPITGKPIERIALPIARGTSCTFGGANLRDLYVTSARKELSPEELTHQPLAGSLFVIKDCGQGVPAFEFRC